MSEWLTDPGCSFRKAATRHDVDSARSPPDTGDARERHFRRVLLAALSNAAPRAYGLRLVSGCADRIVLAAAYPLAPGWL